MITYNYLVHVRLFTDRKIRDLEWPFYVEFSPLRTALSVIRLHTYRRAYLYTILCCITSPAEMCGSGL